jgi:hypothetical protein
MTMPRTEARCSDIHRRIVVSLFVLLNAGSLPALAQTDAAPEHAQRLFAEALQLMQSDHCQDAVQLLLESQRIDSAAATLANLATCYARLGQTGSAFRTYQQAARAAILENKPELQQRTDQAAASLAPKLTRLRVVPMGSGELPSIRINGQVVEDVRASIPLDPGDNIVEATVPGREPWRRVLSTHGEGTLMVVEVPDLGSMQEPIRRQNIEPANKNVRPFDSSSKPVDLRPYSIVAAGIGVTGIALGTVMALGAVSKQNASNAYCDGRFCTQRGLDLRNEALDRAAIATWSTGIGLVSLGAAATLWLISTHRNQETTGVVVSPWISAGRASAGLALEGKL